MVKLSKLENFDIDDISDWKIASTIFKSNTMINKKNLKNSNNSRRHLKLLIKNSNISEKIWKNELKLFKLTNLNFIEWVISKDNYLKIPQKKGHKIINKYLKKNKIKCRLLIWIS